MPNFRIQKLKIITLLQTRESIIRIIIENEKKIKEELKNSIKNR